MKTLLTKLQLLLWKNYKLRKANKVYLKLFLII